MANGELGFAHRFQCAWSMPRKPETRTESKRRLLLIEMSNAPRWKLVRNGTYDSLSGFHAPFMPMPLGMKEAWNPDTCGSSNPRVFMFIIVNYQSKVKGNGLCSVLYRCVLPWKWSYSLHSFCDLLCPVDILQPLYDCKQSFSPEGGVVGADKQFFCTSQMTPWYMSWLSQNVYSKV